MRNWAARCGALLTPTVPIVFRESSMSSPAQMQQPASTGWIGSLLFWACLFAAAGMYGAVDLAPKLLNYIALDREYRINQLRMIELDRQVTHLNRVIEAHASDPGFVREEARSAFDTAPPNEQRIPVESHLRMNIESPAALRSKARVTLPWYTPIVLQIAGSREIENLLLVGAAATVIIAFTFFPTRSR